MFEGECIAITGGAGFIGSHVVERLLSTAAAEIRVIDNGVCSDRSNLASVAGDPRLRIIDADVRDAQALSVLAGCNRLLHLAATKHNASSDPARLVETNINGTYQVLAAAIAGGVQHVVAASSLYVYGTDLPGPYLEESPLLARSLYGATKIAGEPLLRSMTSTAGITGTSLRYFFVYGPRLYQHNYANSLVPRTIRRLLKGQPPVVFGDGQQVFDYLYGGDAADATVQALARPIPSGVVNIGSGVGVSVLDVVAELSRCLEKSCTPEFEAADETAGTVRVGRVQRQHDILGTRSTVSLAEGLQRSVEWCQWRQKADTTAEPTF